MTALHPVIPAQAGIQTGERLGVFGTVVPMDSRLRGNDGVWCG
jgi:hypothetical protein